MVLKILMLVILIYPAITAVKLCINVWKGQPNSFMASTLLEALPRNWARAFSFIFPLMVVALAAVILFMEPL